MKRFNIKIIIIIRLAGACESSLSVLSFKNFEKKIIIGT